MAPAQFPAEVEAFIDTFVEDIEAGDAAIFAGAGLSAGAGFVNWKGLLRNIAKELGLDVDRETNLVALAQFHVNERQSRSAINRRILAEFSAEAELTENHEILSRLPIRTYWTTNYDRLLESALEHVGKVVDVKHSVRQIVNSLPRYDAVLYKMHGDVGHPEDAIITKDDYEGYFRRHELFVSKLSADLTSKTFLFIGFSFSDPNIDYIMTRVRVTLHGSPKQHYCIIRKEQRNAGESGRDYAYRLRQQSYLLNDLKRIGIQCLLIEEYSDITRILRAIERRYRSRTVFLSGSAHVYDDWSIEQASDFLTRIGGELVRSGRSVLSGFGLGVGPLVISGGLEMALRYRKRFHTSQVIARPFPIGVSDPLRARQLFRRHREQMISDAGLAIFVFGNKLDRGGKLVIAPGVIEEFNIATDLGIPVIPVGASGSASRYLWDHVDRNFDKFYPGASKSVKRLFKRIGGPPTSTPSDLADDVIKLIVELSR
jgi:hypothetical protein